MSTQRCVIAACTSRKRNTEEDNSSAGCFYTVLAALSSTGKGMLAHRIRSQLGRHMIGKHQWDATVLLLGRPRKVGVTQKGHCRG